MGLLRGRSGLTSGGIRSMSERTLRVQGEIRQVKPRCIKVSAAHTRHRRRRRRRPRYGRIEGAYERPMIAPSLDCSRATVCPHGSVRASCSSVKPFTFSSSAATWTVSASATSNSTLACGTGRSAGQSEVPKHACAACVRNPRCLHCGGNCRLARSATSQARPCTTLAPSLQRPCFRTHVTPLLLAECRHCHGLSTNGDAKLLNCAVSSDSVAAG
jgi:hypothetical protein